jgi:hypothetical protein
MFFDEFRPIAASSVSFWSITITFRRDSFGFDQFRSVFFLFFPLVDNDYLHYFDWLNPGFGWFSGFLGWFNHISADLIFFGLSN